MVARLNLNLKSTKGRSITSLKCCWSYEYQPHICFTFELENEHTLSFLDKNYKKYSKKNIWNFSLNEEFIQWSLYNLKSLYKGFISVKKNLIVR